MQDDKQVEASPDSPPEPVRPAAPDTEILTELANQPAADPNTHVLSDTDTLAEPQRGPVVIGGKKSHRKLWLSLILLVLVLAIGGLLWWHHESTNAVVTPVATTKQAQAATPVVKTEGLVLDTTKNYGNKYASGILPVGDGKYVTDAPKVGYVYACGGYAKNVQVESGGAGKRGPWFSSDNTTYNLNQKLHVAGSVTWQASFTNTLSGTTRTITTNDLPTHPTGTFPILATDPAYAYDRNPNSITAQTLSFGLNAGPAYATTPTCEGGQVGVMLTGVALNNGFDAGGRDAGAWEIQDSCGGHPQSQGEYHYHTLSSCIKDISVHTVIGYALDGFPITGPTVAPNSVLTTSDLDACHGITSSYTLASKTVTGYHYVMTQDFPYSVSCFRATPIDPPGQKPQPH